MTRVEKTTHETGRPRHPPLALIYCTPATALVREYILVALRGLLWTTVVFRVRREGEGCWLVLTSTMIPVAEGTWLPAFYPSPPRPRHHSLFLTEFVA